MEWALVLCSILIILMGYLVIKHAKNSMKKPAEIPLQEPEAVSAAYEGKPYVLIFGITKLAGDLVQLFQNHGIDYLQIEEQNQLDKTKVYTHLLAISGSDLENLLINTLLNKISNTHKKYALCNNADNEGIYKQSDIYCLNNEDLKADTLFQIMFPSYAIL